MDELTAFQRDILWTVALFEGVDRDPRGARLQEVLECFYPGDVYNARFYSNLKQLEQKGHVEKIEVDGRTNVYPLTDTSREQLFARGMMIVEVLRINGRVVDDYTPSFD